MAVDVEQILGSCQADLQEVGLSLSQGALRCKGPEYDERRLYSLAFELWRISRLIDDRSIGTARDKLKELHTLAVELSKAGLIEPRVYELTDDIDRKLHLVDPSSAETDEV